MKVPVERSFLSRWKKWLLGVPLALLVLVGVPLALAQLPNTLTVRAAPSGTAPAVLADGLDANISINIIPKGTGSLLVNGTAIPGISGGAGTFTTLTVNGVSTLNGLITARPGASIVGDLLGGIVLSNSSTNVTTTLVATEQDLFNFSVPANTLSADNQFLVLDIRVRNAATANAKQTRVYFGATLIGNSTSVVNNNDWHIAQCHVWRTGAAAQKAICHSNNVANAAAWNTANGGGANLSTPGETLSGAVTVRVTGTDAVAAGGTNLEAINLLWYPQGQ